MFRNIDIRKGMAVIAAAAGLALAIWLLMLPPFIGVADNGDFSRLMRIAGFQYLNPDESYEDRYFRFAHQYYGYKSHWGSGYVTTQILPLAVIGWIARLFNGEVFDIRWFGAFYAALFAAAVYLLIRHVPAIPERKTATAVTALLTAAIILFVFGDIGYLAYFQSFYGEPYAYAGMLLLVASAMAMASSDRPAGRLLLLFFFSGFAVATSKIQNAPLGFVFALLAWRLYALREDRKWHQQVLTGIVALLAGSVLMMTAAPDGLRHINLYQSIFYGILKDTPHLERDLEELGIPAQYAVLAGTNYFQKGTAIPQNDPKLRDEVLEKLGHQEIVLYYLRYPERLVNKLEIAAKNAVYVRPSYLGNYDQSAGKPHGALMHAYSGWSDWKAHHLPNTLGWFLLYHAVYAAGLALWWRRTASGKVKLALETMAMVAAAGIFSFVVPVIGDGEADLAKHLFMFNVCFDMMVVSAAAAIAYGIARGWSRLRGSIRKGQLA